MTLKSILIGYLPTKLSKAIAGTTIGLVGTELSLPLILPSSIVSTWDKEKLMVLAILILSTLLLGTLTTLILTTYAYHKKGSESKTPAKLTPTINDEEFKILKYLAGQNHDEISPEEIAETLGINLQIVTFNLGNLKTKQIVDSRPIAPFDHSPKRFWSLKQNGLQYLIENKHIS
jgi:DNA-binding CsgD family transcriptional regulator